MAGKTAHIITTLDQPSIYYWLAFGRPSVNMLKKSVLEFCGVKPVKVTYIGPIRKSTDAYRAKGIKQVEDLGGKLL